MQKRALLALFFSFFIFSNASYGKLNPFKSHACETMVSQFFLYLKKNQMSEVGSKDSRSYLNRFKNNFLVLGLNQSKKIDHGRIRNSFFRSINVTSESNYKDRLSVLKQMNGVEKSEKSILETKRLTLYGDEIEDFLSRYDLLIDNLSIWPRTKIPYVEKGVLLTGLSILGVSLFKSLNQGDLITHALLALNLLVYHQAGQTFSLAKQFFFGRDFKLTSFFKSLKNESFHNEEGFWHYQSFNYEMSDETYNEIQKDIVYDEDSGLEDIIIDDEFYDRSSFLLRWLVLNQIRKKLWISFDFLYHFDPQIEQRTLSIVLRSSDEKPKTKEKKPAKVKKNQLNQKVKTRNGLGGATS